MENNNYDIKITENEGTTVPSAINNNAENNIKIMIEATMNFILEDRKQSHKLLKKFLNDYNNKEIKGFEKVESVELQKTITKLLDSKQKTTEMLIKLAEALNKKQETANNLEINIKFLEKKGINFKEIDDV